MAEVHIDSIKSDKGVFEGDMEMQIIDDSAKTQKEGVNRRKIKQGKGAMLFSNGDFYNGDWAKD
jgi:hypothetical protein